MKSNNDAAGSDIAPARLLRVSEVALLLAVSARTVHRLTSCGVLSIVKVRGSSRWRLADVEAFIAALATATPEQAPRGSLRVADCSSNQPSGGGARSLGQAEVLSARGRAVRRPHNG